MPMKQSEYTKPTAQTLRSLASLYNVSEETMRKWLKKIGMLRNPGDPYTYTPLQVKKIFEKLGEP